MEIHELKIKRERERSLVSVEFHNKDVQFGKNNIRTETDISKRRKTYVRMTVVLIMQTYEKFGGKECRYFKNVSISS